MCEGPVPCTIYCTNGVVRVHRESWTKLQRKVSLQFDQLTTKLCADTEAGDADIASQPAFMEMQVALEGKAGSQMGDAVIPAQPPNFKRALELCNDLLLQSKHLSLLVGFCKAASGVHGFAGLAGALEMAHSVVDNQWQSIHPQEDKDDPDDPWWERINLLRELTDDPKTVDHLYSLNLVAVRHIGAYSMRDIDIATGRKAGTEEEKERCNTNLIRGAFTESAADELAATESAMNSIIGLCDDLDKMFGEKIGADAPSFKNIKSRVQECRGVFRDYAGDKLADAQQPPESDETDSDEPVDTEASLPSPETDTNAVESRQVSVSSTAFDDRDSVALAFDGVMAFYQKYEPSSPVPILLFRARQMVYKNFFDILRELAPQHQDNFGALMRTLKDDPLSFLLEHSYSAFLQGEKFEVNVNPKAVEGTDGTQSPAAAIPEITSREQVVQTLKDIQKFFEVHEPSSPVPLIVQKVRNIVPKNFLDLIAEFERVVEEEPDAKDAKKVAKK